MPPAPSAPQPPHASLPVGWCVAVGRALLLRPALWAVALRQVRRLAPPRWWARRPFLPVPPAGYLGFRSLTMYGDAGRLPTPEDVLTYLDWCRTFPAASRRERPSRTPAVAGTGRK